MINRLLLLFCFVLLLSCNEQAIELPKVNISGLHDIENHSGIWFFYHTENGDTISKVNKNNKLINTHWIYHIDKRLSMHSIYKDLNKLQANNRKPSMHKNGEFASYLSYADVTENKLALFEFPYIQYVKTELAQLDSINPTYRLTLQKKDISLKGQLITIEDLKDLQLKDSVVFTLTYSGNLSYQNYLETKIKLQSTQIELNNSEYIYSVK